MLTGEEGRERERERERTMQFPLEDWNIKCLIVVEGEKELLNRYASFVAG